MQRSECTEQKFPREITHPSSACWALQCWGELWGKFSHQIKCWQHRSPDLECVGWVLGLGLVFERFRGI